MNGSIVGKSFVISTKRPTTDQYTHRTVHILDEHWEDGKRMYRVKEPGKQPFTAIADIYDRYFHFEKGNMRPKGYRDKLDAALRQARD